MWKTVIKNRTKCLVVGFLALISAVLGFAAEFTNIKDSQVHDVSPGVCSYPPSPAYGLGMTSAIVLLLAHIIINYTSGCFCCRKNSYTPTIRSTLALICFVESWFTFVVAFLLLLGGAVLNNQNEVQVHLGHKSACYIFGRGNFVVATVLSLVSVTFSILCFFITAHAEVVELQIFGFGLELDLNCTPGNSY